MLYPHFNPPTYIKLSYHFQTAHLFEVFVFRNQKVQINVKSFSQNQKQTHLWKCIYAIFRCFLEWVSYTKFIRFLQQIKPQLSNQHLQCTLKPNKIMIQVFSVQAFIFVIILVFYVLTSHVVEFKKIPYVHESMMAILMGMLTAAFAKYVLKQQIEFNNEIFFTIILPPIIFSAGYSLRKSLFFQNFGMVAFLGIVGTIIGFLCLSVTLLFLNNYFFHALSLTEVLLVSSVLCATDTVAAMSLIKPQKFPVLNAVLFGQGIINDAVAIILFGTISNLKLDQTGGQFTFKVVGQMAFDFCYLFFFSMAFGIFTGFGLSYLFKVYESFNKYPLKQTSLILLNGYFTYLLGQLIGLSGIITLFTCAIIMGHYCFMNISEESQKATGLAFQTVGYMCEAFVFAYLGASILSIESQWAAILMGFLILLVLPVVRAIMVYIMPLVYGLLRKQFPMNQKQLKICWYSGLMRGVIAFALCLQIETEHEEFITTVTLMIVLTTSLLGSSFMKSFAQKIGIKDEQQEAQLSDKIDQNKQMEIITQRLPSSSYKSIVVNSLIYKQNSQSQQNVKESSQKVQNSSMLRKLQKKYIQPMFQKRGKDKKQNSSYQEQMQQKNELQPINSNKSEGLHKEF